MTSGPRGPRVVGIDLGTTNSVLAWADMGEGGGTPVLELLDVPQVVEAGAIESRSSLPSAVLLTRDDELASPAFRLPWVGEAIGVVGAFAARRASEEPDRVVGSAKSWLCKRSTDRAVELLPWVGDDREAPERRISAVEAQAAILEHLRRAFDARLAAGGADGSLATHEVVLTVPASFDPEARELTLEAARRAGLPDVRLLEEPQAAVYAWLAAQGEGWRQNLGLGDLLLVCDIGGGTTDLSLVGVAEIDGSLSLERLAVGDHLLLGGDNVDLALAHHLRGRLAGEGQRLDGWQFRALVAACRDAKERLLGPAAPGEAQITIPSRGRRLVGGTLRAQLTRAEIERIVVDGFLPEVGFDCVLDEPDDEFSGLEEMGLPFERDPAITRHVLRFLRRHAPSLAEQLPERVAGGLLHPTAILFNGGAMSAPALCGRIADVLGNWARACDLASPRVLAGAHLAHACALGAAYYGAVRHGRGLRIRGGTARSFYVGVASAQPAVPGHPPPIKALCVVPHGLEEGTRLEVPGSEIGLRIGGRARFRFFSSGTRLDDRPGVLLDEWDAESLDELTSLEVRFADEADGLGRVPVRLEAFATEVGTLELEFVERAGGRSWRLTYEVRAGRGVAP